MSYLDLLQAIKLSNNITQVHGFLNTVRRIYSRKTLCLIKRLKTSKHMVIITTTILRRTSYQRIYLEEIRSICDQITPNSSHPGVQLPKKYPTNKTIQEELKG